MHRASFFGAAVALLMICYALQPQTASCLRSAWAPAQQGCNASCVRENLNAEVLLRAKNSGRCCGETLSLRLGPLLTLSAKSTIRQVKLGFGHPCVIKASEPSAEHSREVFLVNDDDSLLRAIVSPLASTLWFSSSFTTPYRSTGFRPLLEIRVSISEWPSSPVALTLGAPHLSSYVWKLASRKSGDALASVDLRHERLIHADLTKEDVAIEVPRRKNASAIKLRRSQSEIIERQLPLGGPVDPRRVVIGIVIDAKKRYVDQALLWLRSLISMTSWSSGKHTFRPRVLACVLPGVPSWLKNEFSAAGVYVREILPLSDLIPGATPHSNKLRLLQQPECSGDVESVSSAFDVCVYMDTDTIFLNGDLFSFLRADPVVQFRAGRTLWADTVAMDNAWHRIFELAGVMRMRPGRDAFPLAERWPNTGVLVFPVALVPSIFDRWLHYTDKCLGWLTALKQDLYFTETVSFLLAILTLKVPKTIQTIVKGGNEFLEYEMLPVQANTQLNLPLLDFKRNGYLSSLSVVGPTLLHYPLDTLAVKEGEVYGFGQETVDDFGFLQSVNDRLALLESLRSRQRQSGIHANEQSGLIVYLINVHAASTHSECRSFIASEEEVKDISMLLSRIQMETKGFRVHWIDDENEVVELQTSDDLFDALVTKIKPIQPLLQSNVCFADHGNESIENYLLLLVE